MPDEKNSYLVDITQQLQQWDELIDPNSEITSNDLELFCNLCKKAIASDPIIMPFLLYSSNFESFARGQYEELVNIACQKDSDIKELLKLQCLKPISNCFRLKKVYSMGSNLSGLTKDILELNSLPNKLREKLFGLFVQYCDIENIISDITEEYLEQDKKYSNILTSMLKNHRFGFLLIIIFTKPFMQGLMISNFSCDHLLINLASTADQKKDSYLYDPIFLSDHSDDLERFLEILVKNKDRPLRVRFLIEGTHYRCGDIESSNDKFNVLYIDPLGENGYARRDLPTIVSMLTVNGKKPNVYFDVIERQHSALGCQFFCLDDVRHLFTVEGYIGCNLFNYFDNQEGVDGYKDLPDVKKIKFPPSFMRTTQSRKLMSEIFPSYNEKELQNVNKKGQSVYDGVPDFKKEEDGTWSGLNLRLDRKLKKMGRRVLIYLLGNPDLKKVHTEMQAFTLDGFRKRFAAQESFYIQPKI